MHSLFCRESHSLSDTARWNLHFYEPASCVRKRNKKLLEKRDFQSRNANKIRSETEFGESETCEVGFGAFERCQSEERFTVDSSDKYFSTISRMWSRRNTPKDCTKLWSSCVRHVHREIMLPLPTRAARTSTSAKETKENKKLILRNSL